MPRKNRIDAPGALHHVIIRGIDRSLIFRDSQDYENFISRLAQLLNETSTFCYAWALMKNHAHLLLRSGPSPLTSFMRRLLTGYAQQFNRRHNRSGHLFQNRYKSFLCEEDPYLLELVRYIHLNPIRAGAAKDMAALEKFRWCGHGVLMGKIKQDWQDSSFVLSLFHEKQSFAKRAYYLFVEKGIALGKRSDLVGGGLIRSAGGWVAVQSLRKSKERFANDERILGSSEFVASVLKKANEDYEKKISVRTQHLDIEKIIDVVCEHLGLNPALLNSPSKQTHITRARAIISSIAFDTLRLKGVDIAQRLNLTPTAISKLSAKGRTDRSVIDISRSILTI
jgi:REP element-mobilizing transposase RayT